MFIHYHFLLIYYLFEIVLWMLQNISTVTQVTNLYAVSSRYGTPDDFKRLVDEAHGYHSSPDSIQFFISMVNHSNCLYALQS